jgi:eukaryotic-like serine/threonine-protein kinase
MTKLRSGTLFILLMLLIGCKSSLKDEQSFFHANATHTGYYHTTGVRQLHGVKWSFKTDGKVFSSPVICNNKVFVGSDDSFIYALNTSDGSLSWKFKTGGRVSSSVAVFNSKIYAVSFDGYIYCLAQNSGNMLWKFRSAGERVFEAPGIHGLPEKDRILKDPWDMFLSSPVVANGSVFFGCGSGVCYALDCDSGKKEWEFATSGVIHSSPAYSDSTVFFGSWDSYMYALNSNNGLLRWKYKTGTDTVYYNQVGFQSSPVVYKGVVYSGCRDANVWALDAKTGELKWKYYNNGSWVIVTPAIHNDTLYFTTSDTHKLIALATSTGKELYKADCRTYGFSSPAITDGLVYAGNFGGSLIAFNTKNGNSVWEFKTQAAMLNRDQLLTVKGEFDFPKIFKENTYDGMVQAMNILYSLGSILSSPAVSEGVIYFGSTDGKIYALN